MRVTVYAKNCPSRQILDRIGDTWSVLVVVMLADGTHRYTELASRIEGVSPKMLTQTLRGLERDGLVKRKAYATIPPRVEYSLTPLGASLTEVISTIRLWAYGHMDDITDARAAFDAVLEVASAPD